MTFDEWCKKIDPGHERGWPERDFMREAWNAAVAECEKVVTERHELEPGELTKLLKSEPR